ncbi:MAG: hypothetical protein IKN14_00645 [Clostridiales bacterium]|nr:hypothetical protein [Clostridiales bacterium]
MKQIRFEIYELSPTAYQYYKHYASIGTSFYEDEDGYYMDLEESRSDPAYLGYDLFDVDQLFCDLYKIEHEELKIW